MRPWLAIVWVAAIAGCGSQPLRAPRILSITPSEKVDNDAVDVVVELETIMGFSIDYQRSSASIDRTLNLSVGPLMVGSGRYEPNGRLEAFIPSGLPAGLHDVKVQLADFRTATLEDGFLVHAGLWPDGYTIDAVQNQRVNVPFLITIRATGPNAPSFQGTLEISNSVGSMNPHLTGRFENGVRVQSVVFTTTAPATWIQVRDLNNRFTNSNVFRVDP